MKTPEEIKRGLECCLRMNCKECGYDREGIFCANVLRADAMLYIQQLEAENERTMSCYDAAVCVSADVAAMLPKWISVEERMPTKEEAERCHIVRARYDGPQGGYITRYDAMYLPGVSVWRYHNGLDWDVLSVTHWLWIPEIPEAPEEVQHEAD